MPLIPTWAAHAVALLLVAIDAAVRALRLRFLLPSRERISLWGFVVINAVGEASAAVTPARIGGEPARFLAFKRAGTATGEAAAALAVERVVDLSSIAFVGVCLGALFGREGLGGLLQTLGRVSPRVLGIGATLLALALVAGWLATRRYRSHAGSDRSRTAPWAGLRLATPRAVAWATAFGFVSIACRVAILPVLCLGLPISLAWGPAILGSFALLYSQLVLPTPSGLGGVEAGFAVGFAGVLPPTTAAGLLVAWRAYTLGIGAVAGLGFAIRGLLRRRGSVGILLCAAAISVASPSAAQPIPQGSRNLAVGHWAYESIRELRSRGYLSDLNPTVQPYRRLDVARGLEGLSPEELPPPVDHWVRLLRDELAPELERLEGVESRSWGVELSGGLRGSSGDRPDALRQTGEADAWWWYQAGGWAETGPLAAETRVLGDYFLEHDPVGLPPGQRRYGRADNAYLSASFALGNVTLGRMERNWTVSENEGLLLSAQATAIPQLYVELAMGPFTLRSVTAELDTIGGLKRYLAGHRLDYETPSLVLSFGESILHASDYGLSLRFLNPLEFLFFDHDNAPNEATQNLVLDWQVWWRPGPFTLRGEIALDDLDWLPSKSEHAPPRYAARVGVEEHALLDGVDVALEYERVSSYAYRTQNGMDRYTFLGRGLATNYSDYDLLTLAADVHPPLPGLRLTPSVQLLRQGEGDLRDPIPDEVEFYDSPGLLLGTVERTVRIGVEARYQPVRHLWAEIDVGRNFVSNDGNVGGSDKQRFTGTFSFGGSIDLPGR